jgi:3',5'-cyclic AMP phosphodiesterase CpdA
MERKMTKVQLLLIAVALTLSSCTKTSNYGETANQRFILSMDWNNRHAQNEIVELSDEYSILSMGDSHVGTTVNIDSFLTIAAISKPAAVVMAGDLTDGTEKGYWDFYRHLPEENSIPMFLVAGNHDFWGKGSEAFFTMFGSSTYIFTIETPVAKDLFICLETAGGTLGTSQLDWLKNILSEVRPGYRHCMVFTHNNFFRTRHTDSTNPETEEVAVLSEIFLRNNVDMVITAHDHKHDALKFGTTTYIVMDALKDGVDNAGYFRIDVKNGEINYVFESM